MLHLKLLGFLLAVFTVVLAASADAQGISISYAKKSHHGTFAIELSSPHVPTFGHYRGYERRAPRRMWVPGRYEWVTQRVWVPGECRRVWIEPVYETRWDACGRSYSVCVRAGYWHTISEPGHYADQRVSVWAPGVWQTSTY